MSTRWWSRGRTGTGRCSTPGTGLSRSSSCWRRSINVPRRSEWVPWATPDRSPTGRLEADCGLMVGGWPTRAFHLGNSVAVAGPIASSDRVRSHSGRGAVVLAPLRDVASHVEQADRTRASGGDRMRRALGILRVPGDGADQAGVVLERLLKRRDDRQFATRPRSQPGKALSRWLSQAENAVVSFQLTSTTGQLSASALAVLGRGQLAAGASSRAAPAPAVLRSASVTKCVSSTNSAKGPDGDLAGGNVKDAGVRQPGRTHPGLVRAVRDEYHVRPGAMRPIPRGRYSPVPKISLWCLPNFSQGRRCCGCCWRQRRGGPLGDRLLVEELRELASVNSAARAWRWCTSAWFGGSPRSPPDPVRLLPRPPS